MKGFSGPEFLCKKGHWPTKSFHWLCVPDGLKHCKQRAFSFDRVNAELQVTPALQSFDNASWKTWTILKVMM